MNRLESQVRSSWYGLIKNFHLEQAAVGEQVVGFWRRARAARGCAWVCCSRPPPGPNPSTRVQ